MNRTHNDSRISTTKLRKKAIKITRYCSVSNGSKFLLQFDPNHESTAADGERDFEPVEGTGSAMFYYPPSRLIARQNNMKLTGYK